MEWLLLAGLSEEEQQTLFRHAVRHRFGRREVIFHESGHVALRVTTPLGDRAVIRVVRPGEFFGELVLLADSPRSATAIAVEGAATRALHRSVFDDLRQTHPAVQEALSVALAGQLRRTTGALIDALFLPAAMRLWRRMRTLAELYPQEHDAVIPLTQDEIAQLAGMTRPTANRLLREAEAEGAIALSRGHVTIIDRAWIDHHAHEDTGTPTM
jgi:CRP-like cAMP-binding protein